MFDAMLVRRMPPRSGRDREERFEVADDKGRPLGWIRVWTSARGRRFYDARVTSPKAEEVSLGSDTDMWTRLDAIERFGLDPEQFRRVWAREYSGHVDDSDRIVHGGDGRGPKS